MKANLFYIFSSVLLLLSGIHLFAETQDIAHNQLFSINMQSNEHLNHKNSNRSTLLIQFADLGVEEEFHTDNDLNNLAGNKITPGKPCLLNSWYVSFSENFIFKTYTRSKALALNYVVSSDPIYLIIGVLRI